MSIKIKRHGLAWGTFLIIVGFYYLFTNVTGAVLNFGDLLKLWPVIFIIIGARYLSDDEYYLLAVSFLKGLYFALMFVGLATINFNPELYFKNKLVNFHIDVSDRNRRTYNSDSNKDLLDSNHKILYFDSLKTAKLVFEGGAGVYKFYGGDSITFYAENFNKVIHTEFNNNEDDDEDDDDSNKRYDILINSILNSDTSHIDLDVATDNSNKILRMSKQQYQVQLGKKPEWDLQFSFGAGTLNLDLSTLSVRSLKMEVGASQVNLKLSDLNRSANVDISSGMANVDLMLPKNVGCIITSNTALSGQNFNGFIKDGPTYRSKNFNKDGKTIYINIDGGLSNYNVSWY